MLEQLKKPSKQNCACFNRDMISKASTQPEWYLYALSAEKKAGLLQTSFSNLYSCAVLYTLHKTVHVALSFVLKYV